MSVSSTSPRRQRKALYTADSFERRLRMGVPLSRELRSRFRRRAVPIRKGDTVRVLSGSFAGREERVAKVHRRDYRVTLDNVTLKTAEDKLKPLTLGVSNLVITRLNLSDAWRRRSLRVSEEEVTPEERGKPPKARRPRNLPRPPPRLRLPPNPRPHRRRTRMMPPTSRRPRRKLPRLPERPEGRLRGGTRNDVPSQAPGRAPELDRTPEGNEMVEASCARAPRPGPVDPPPPRAARHSSPRGEHSAKRGSCCARARSRSMARWRTTSPEDSD